MIQNDALLGTVALLGARMPSFEKELRKKVCSTLLSLKLREAREIASAGASQYFQTVIDTIEIPALLKVSRKFDPHLPGRDAMPDAWLRAHVKKLIASEVEPANSIKKPRQPKAGKVTAAPPRNKPEKVKVVVNG